MDQDVHALLLPLLQIILRNVQEGSSRKACLAHHKVAFDWDSSGNVSSSSRVLISEAAEPTDIVFENLEVTSVSIQIMGCTHNPMSLIGSFTQVMIGSFTHGLSLNNTACRVSDSSCYFAPCR